MTDTTTHVDGNAVLGALSLALGTNAGAAALTCAACGNHHAVAETWVYLRCPGIVVRCPNCGGAEIVLVEIAHRFVLTVCGTARIDLATVPS